MRAIAFGAGDTLFGASLTGRLYRLNANTADTVFIGTAPLMPYSSLSFRPINGELWASIRPVLSGRDSIYKVNTSNGAATLVGNTGDHQITPHIAFAPSGILYGLKGTGVQISTIIQIDTNTAAGTLSGSTGVRGLLAIAMRTDSSGVSAVAEHLATPSSTFLYQNYANPFNPTTVMAYELGVKSDVRLVVYDLLGCEVATLVEQTQEAGFKSVEWDASGMPSGVYFYRLFAVPMERGGVEGSRTGPFVATKKMLLLH
jgi:hypothetical protein